MGLLEIVALNRAPLGRGAERWSPKRCSPFRRTANCGVNVQADGKAHDALRTSKEVLVQRRPNEARALSGNSGSGSLYLKQRLRSGVIRRRSLS